MSNALELTDDDFRIAPDAPPGFWSKDGRTNLFTILFISAAILGFIQLIVPQFLVPMLMPRSMPSVFSFKIEAVQAAQSVWWQDRLWTTVTIVVPGSPPRTVLRAFHDDGKWDPTSDLIIPAPFETLHADGERLYLISSTNVTTIENRQVRTTYPKVKLAIPSQPFVVNGQLSLFDRGTSGQSEVVWYDYRDGEWIERGNLELPKAYRDVALDAVIPIGRPAPFPRLRFGSAITVTTDTLTDGIYPITLPDGRVWVAAVFFGEHLSSQDAKVWSAINPTVMTATSFSSNQLPADALGLNDPSLFVAWQERSGDFASPAAVTLFNDRPAFIALTYPDGVGGASGKSLQLFTEKDGTFLMTQRLAGFPAESPVPLVKPDGTLLFVATSPIAPMSLNTVELTKDGFGPIKRVGDPSFMDTSRPNFWPLYALISVIPLSTTLLLGTIAHVLVERHRDRRYSFGHHTVKLASIARRGAARAIDSILFGLPMWVAFGVLWALGDVMAIIEERINNNDFQTLIIWGLGFALGMMCYVILAVLVFGTMEGLWGLSPGKWLFNIRVIRTTFAPIGFFRGMIRQFLLIIDGLFNYFVAILMASCLPRSQRLGDMCADSIVVERASLPPHWPRHSHTPPG